MGEHSTPATGGDPISLTQRELEVAELIGAGRTNGEIAELLGIGFGTAKWHVSQVLAKLEVERREDVCSRLEALSRKPRPARRWSRWGALPFFQGLGLAKGLGVAAAVVPVAGVALAGVMVMRSTDSGAGAPEPSSPETTGRSCRWFPGR